METYIVNFSIILEMNIWLKVVACCTQVTKTFKLQNFIIIPLDSKLLIPMFCGKNATIVTRKETLEAVNIN